MYQACKFEWSLFRGPLHSRYSRASLWSPNRVKAQGNCFPYPWRMLGDPSQHLSHGAMCPHNPASSHQQVSNGYRNKQILSLLQNPGTAQGSERLKAWPGAAQRPLAEREELWGPDRSPRLLTPVLGSWTGKPGAPPEPPHRPPPGPGGRIRIRQSGSGSLGGGPSCRPVCISRCGPSTSFLQASGLSVCSGQ